MCRFELKIIGTDRFQCAADPYGFAYIYGYEDYESPCPYCQKKIDGKPTRIKKELKPKEFWEVAGKLIRQKDWEAWNAPTGRR